MMKKGFKLAGKIIFILAIVIVGVFVSNYYILPRLSSCALFQNSSFFQKFRENVTIVNRTEQITVKEDVSVNKIASQAGTTVVEIISLPEVGSAEKDPKIGNGIILTSDGLVTTYRTSVLEKNARYAVTLFDGTIFTAQFLGVDEYSNLAFFKAETTNLPVTAFANSNDAFAGKKLIAVGKAKSDYQNRYAAGILSDVNKTFPVSGEALSSAGKLEGVLETDFVDSESFVGCPVIDYNGEMVGLMGSALVNGKPKYFQIPANAVKEAMEKVLKNELGLRANLGVYYVSLEKSFAFIHKLERDRGALVFSPSGKQTLAVMVGSPAEKAGVKINDIILAVSGQEINLDNPLSRALSQFKKGDRIELSVWRGKEELKIPVVL